ncbi:MAG: tRNA (adenosine(37)-N6)-threonylcarbamoyltransferase complex ATPase subunit type 1 TsaE [Candidatus Marinimicrobia bacterium]|nr:tRNA (adenosine(37)-N6)-threonylcarbamoyltransferase complex ATPase subunit type 1 TsaE [Candidatus Neomarinimicrobiota bacterium]
MSVRCTFRTNSPGETQQIASKLAQFIKPGDILAFYGDLASGKTTFIQGFGQQLNAREPINSPTFTLINEYNGDIPIYHFDCYRLTGPDELFDIGYEEYFYGDGVTVVEWAEKIEDVIPEDAFQLHFTHLFHEEESREITIECPENREEICSSLQ